MKNRDNEFFREEELDELHTLFEENRHIFLYGIAGIGKSERL